MTTPKVDPVEVAKRCIEAPLNERMEPVAMSSVGVQVMARVVLAAAEWRDAHATYGTVDARTHPDEFAAQSNRCDIADDALVAELEGR
jgi:hypothetical protein